MGEIADKLRQARQEQEQSGRRVRGRLEGQDRSSRSDSDRESTLARKLRQVQQEPTEPEQDPTELKADRGPGTVEGSRTTARLMAGAGEGLGETAGAAIGFLNELNPVAQGLELGRALQGEESPQVLPGPDELSNQLGEAGQNALTIKGQDISTDNFAGQTGRLAAAGAPVGAGFSFGARALTGLPGVAGRIASNLGARPGAAAGAEAAVSPPIAASGELAVEQAGGENIPEEEQKSARAQGQLFGALGTLAAGPAAATASKILPTRFLAKQVEPFSSRAQKQEAARLAGETVKREGEDPFDAFERVRAEIEEGPEGFNPSLRLTVAEITGDPNLAKLQNKRAADPQFNEAVNRRFDEILERGDQSQAAPGPPRAAESLLRQQSNRDANPREAQEAFLRETERSKARMNLRERRVLDNLNEALYIGEGADSRQAAERAAEEVQRLFDEAESEKQRLLGEVAGLDQEVSPKKVSRIFESVNKQGLGESSENLIDRDLQSIGRRFKDRSRNATVGDVWEARSSVLQKLRDEEAKTTPNRKKIARLEDLESRLLNTIGESLGRENSDAFQRFRDFVRQTENAFQRSPLARALGTRSSQAGPRDPATDLDQVLGGATAGSQQARSATDIIENELRQDPTELKNALEEQLLAKFNNQVFGSMGQQQNPQQLAKKTADFMNRYQNVLTEHPSVRDRMQRALETFTPEATSESVRPLFRNLREASKSAERRIQDSMAAKVTGRDPTQMAAELFEPGAQAATATRATRTPSGVQSESQQFRSREERARSLMQTIERIRREQGEEAANATHEGVKKGVIDWLITKLQSGGARGRVREVRNSVLGGEGDGQKALQAIFPDSGERERLRDTLRTMSRIEEVAEQGGDIRIPESNLASMLTIGSRFGGTTIARALNTGTIQVPGQGGAIGRMLGRLPDHKVQEFLDEAILDPEKFKDLRSSKPSRLRDALKKFLEESKSAEVGRRSFNIRDSRGSPGRPVVAGDEDSQSQEPALEGLPGQQGQDQPALDAPELRQQGR